MAVAQAGSCSSESTPSLGTSMCHGSGPTNGKKKKKKKDESGDITLPDFKIKLIVTKGEMWWGGINWDVGINIHTLLYIK